MIAKVVKFGVFLLMTQTDAETLFYAALMTALELSFFVFIVKYKPLFRIRNWWTVYKLQPSGKFEYKHYVRVIEKTHKPAEGIYEIGTMSNGNGKPMLNGQKILHKFSGMAQKCWRMQDITQEIKWDRMLFVATIKKIESNKFYTELKKDGAKEPVHLDLDSAHDLNVGDRQIRFVYTNIKVRANKANWQKIVSLIGAVLLFFGYICYLKFFADPNHLYSFGFISMMVGIIFFYLIYLFKKNR